MRDTNRQIPGFCERAQRFMWRGWVVIIRHLPAGGGYLVWASHADAVADFWVGPEFVRPGRWCPAEIARAIMHELRLYDQPENVRPIKAGVA